MILGGWGLFRPSASKDSSQEAEQNGFCIEYIDAANLLESSLQLHQNKQSYLCKRSINLRMSG